MHQSIGVRSKSRNHHPEMTSVSFDFLLAMSQMVYIPVESGLADGLLDDT